MAIEVPKEAEEQVVRLQQYQQQFQMLNSQKQNIQVQLIEIDHSLDHLNKVVNEDTYEIVGTIMIKREKEELINDLNERKSNLDLRNSVISKQVDKISKKLNDIQEKIMKIVNKEKNK